MCFYYLLFGHLMGDFVLQTDIIAENKLKYARWNVLHSAVVTLCMFLLSIPFGFSVMLLVILAGIAHYFIDFYKPKIAQRYPMPGLLYFVADQAMHIAMIRIISSFAINNSKYLLLDMVALKFLLIAVFISSFSAILSQYILNLIFKFRNKKFFEDFEKSIGILTRISMVAGLYLSLFSTPLFLLVIVSVIITLFFYYRYSSWRSWMKFDYFTVKLLTDFVISFIGLVFMIYL